MNRSSERNYYIYSGGIAIDSISLLLELLCRGMFILNPQVQPNKKNLEDIRASYNAQKKQLERKKPDDIDSSNDVRQKHDSQQYMTRKITNHNLKKEFGAKSSSDTSP